MTRYGQMQRVMLRVLAVMLVTSFLVALLGFVRPQPVKAQYCWCSIARACWCGTYKWCDLYCLRCCTMEPRCFWTPNACALACYGGCLCDPGSCPEG